MFSGLAAAPIFLLERLGWGSLLEVVAGRFLLLLQQPPALGRKWIAVANRALRLRVRTIA